MRKHSHIQPIFTHTYIHEETPKFKNLTRLQTSSYLFHFLISLIKTFFTNTV